jgi:hypothetical protein
VLEVGGALVDKRIHPFSDVLGVEDFGKEIRLDFESFL